MLNSSTLRIWVVAGQVGLCAAATFSVQCLAQTTTIIATDYAKILQSNEDSVVHIQVTKTRKDGVGAPEIRTATGFLISDRGHVLSVRHVVPPSDTNSVVKIEGAIRSPSNHHYRMEYIKGDDDLDLALLLFPNVGIQWRPVTFGNSRSVPDAANLYALGFPGNLELSPAVGLLSNHFGPHGTWQTTIPINRGNSGSPVFDISGTVVAIASAGREDMESVTYAIPEAYATGLRQYAWNSLPPTSDFASVVKSGGGKIARRFTFFANAEGEQPEVHEKVFCLPQKYKVAVFKPSVVTSSGDQTKITNLNVNPADDSCVSFDAVVSGNKTTKIGPISVESVSNGWLGVDLDVLGVKRSNDLVK